MSSVRLISGQPLESLIEFVGQDLDVVRGGVHLIVLVYVGFQEPSVSVELTFRFLCIFFVLIFLISSSRCLLHGTSIKTT